MMVRTNSAVRIRRWHGLAGGVTWDLLCATVLLGVLEFLEMTLFTVITLTLVVATWLVVHIQLKMSSDATNPSDYPGAGAGGSSSSSGGGMLSPGGVAITSGLGGVGGIDSSSNPESNFAAVVMPDLEAVGGSGGGSSKQ